MHNRECGCCSLECGTQSKNTSRTSIQHKDLGLFAYNVELTQQLKANDHPIRYRFSIWALEQLKMADNFSLQIIFLKRRILISALIYVNKQNCRIWSSENPHLIVEKPSSESASLMLIFEWFHHWPFFFVNEAGNAVSVNVEHYRGIKTVCLWSEIEGMDLDNFWFQENGATSQASHQTIELLRTIFVNSVLSCFGDVKGPLFNFFLWSTLERNVMRTIYKRLRPLSSVFSSDTARNHKQRLGKWGWHHALLYS